MNGQRPDVPIIGRQTRVVITDHSVIAPNQVEVVDNGLSMGDSIAHLRIMDPLRQRSIMVPITLAQADELSRQLLVTLGEAYDNHKQRSQHGH